MPSKVLSYATPLDRLHEVHSLQYLETNLPLKVFECSTFVHLHSASKLEPRFVKCVFIGYSSSQKGYKCFDPSSSRLFVSHDVTFSENEPFYPTPSTQRESWSEFQSFFEYSPVPSIDLTPPKPAFVPDSFFEPVSVPDFSSPKTRENASAEDNKDTSTIEKEIITYKQKKKQGTKSLIQNQQEVL